MHRFARLLEPLAPYAGRAVLVAVSGGADSVALLLGAHEAGARVVAATFDHQLRADSAQDVAFVQDVCARLGVPCEVGGADVARVARARGWSVEAAARTLRYAFLTRAAKARRVDVILTAHTARDDAETYLMEALRGEAHPTGIPEANGHVRRPWLRAARADVEAYLQARAQAWREDPSNADTYFTRNWVRHAVMPVLTAREAGAEDRLARTARLAREDDAALEALAARVTPHMPKGALPRAVRRRYVTRALRSARAAYHAEHVDALADALANGGTTHVTLPGARTVTVTDGELHLTPPATPTPEFPIPPGWTLRHRQPGDRVRLPGGTRKLSDVLTDRKVPRANRDAVWVLALGADVQWVGLQPPVWAVGAAETTGAPADLDHVAMGEALAAAREAFGNAEVPVGAVITGPDGQVVARAANTARAHGDMTRHAELDALRAAAATLGTAYLTGCTLYVTLEPCPMCLGAALEARVSRIVFGARNPKLGALGGVTDVLAYAWGHRPDVQGGVRAREASALLTGAFRTYRAD
ncbi:tRNA lysidine(34) synthetase TilS [Deinococcus maricopensis]|uniref:Multifunctional fusion protein n=1 Tax=Deinococcus maricopensis (strain DSM 21211 / LMG 22137 / NRRL B-23946 / LB-34) TaxID=709986 RepID=E8U8H7_DEIML|nr:tRNA lysidine(34) synthetase TilS [Deinococcus maricopensis]ADV67366.1 tRNA(Ile)-lysidine synthase [Deinococcus maricopensis DSM 21211]